jgi:hypothetical protein
MRDMITALLTVAAAAILIATWRYQQRSDRPWF